MAVPGSALFPPGDSSRPGASGRTLSLDFVGIVRDEAKRAVARLRDTVRVEGSPDVRRKNIQYRTGFTLPPGTYRLKVVARENQSGRFGSFETDLVVPDLRRRSVKVSSVVFGTQLETSGKRDASNPLLRDGSELLPSVTQVVSARQPLYFYYEAYDAARAPSGQTVSGSLFFSPVYFLGHTNCALS